MGTAPLDWRCPLEVETGEGASVRVEHQRQLLNQPANLRWVCADSAVDALDQSPSWQQVWAPAAVQRPWFAALL
jgi:hypothetical protein